MVKIPEHHVLNFFYDNDNGCALTVWVKGSRYHIIADASRLQDRSKRGKQVWRTYARLLEQVKAADQDDGHGGNTTAPLFVQPNEGEETSDSEDKDSGVDMSESDEEEHDSTPTEALQRWMLKPLVSSFPPKEPKDVSVDDWYHCPTFYCTLYVEDGKLQTDQNDTPSSAYQKRMDDLIPEMTLPKYINELKIPVYSAQDIIVIATSHDPAPLHPALVRVDGKELFMKTVGSAPFQPMVKRELQVMKHIEAEGLHNEIRVPLLRGLVHFGPPRGEPTGKQRVMGFVIDPISDPTPLTHMLDKDVPEEKRQKWADESARMVDLLHQHNIIWGDSKGDNFMVDANDDLWIIDFGGSYTEGWVDPELKETEEGDKQGLRKLCNGLEDPEKYTLDGDEEAETEREDEKAGKKKSGSKRKHDAEEKDYEEPPSKQSKKSEENAKSAKSESKEEDNNGNSKSKRKHTEQEHEDDSQPPTKQSKKSEQRQENPDDSEETYCYCNGPDSGRMLACDNKDCKRQWFHFDCIGIVEAPSTKKWYCEECKPTHNPRSSDSCHGTWDVPYEED